jgi:uncharacterized protein
LPVPFRQFVLKVHSRCDLACRYCYVYEHADQSWRSRPKAISEETVTWFANRLAEHAKTHGLPTVHVILHGGEPLLAGPARLRRICEILRAGLTGTTELDLRIHTNGVQLSERFLDLFVEHDVKVGISLDGDRAANDRHRRYADGRSSHQQVLRAAGLLRQKRYRHLFAGLLCTIDTANDPIAVYDALAALEPPRIDFLLPHATWDEPPVRPDDAPTVYADWLTAIFDRWNGQGRPMPVRLFDSVISTLSGGPSLTESMGLGPADLVVVETDGTLEQADSLKIAYDGAPATGFDVFSHSFDTAAGHPGMAARQQGLAGLSRQCRACPVVRSCGGGLYAHRYRTGSGFDNPSVYCTDLMSLVRQIDSRIGPSTSAAAGAATRSGPGIRSDVEPLPGFDRLADGTDDGTAVRALAAAQQRVTRGWLTVIRDAVGDRGGELWDAAWQLLAELESRPEGPGTLLSYPYTRSWAAGCLHALDAESASPPQLGHLAALAACAAWRAGRSGSVRVPVGVDGTVVLPTLGRVRFAAAGTPSAEVAVDGSGLLVRLGGADVLVAPAAPASGGAPPGARWEPVRRLTDRGADAGPETSLEDVDPYRDRYRRPVLPRLPEPRAEGLRRGFADAMRLLREKVPSQVAGVAAALTTVTPLGGAGRAGGAGVLADGTRGLGAIGVRPDTDAATLARDVLYGHRLATLDALLEQCDLYDETDPRTFPVRWCEGPLSVAELLAHVHARSGAAALAADPARHAADTERALDTLIGSAALTPLGERFAAGLRSALETGR